LPLAGDCTGKKLSLSKPENPVMRQRMPNSKWYRPLTAADIIKILEQIYVQRSSFFICDKWKMRQPIACIRA
jgi:hypothetical protein